MIHTISYEKIRSQTKILGNYDVLINYDQEVLIHLTFKVPGEATSPVFYYSGGKHAILAKNDRCLILCDCLHVETQPVLSKCTKVLFVESDHENEFLSEYEAALVMTHGIDELGERLLNDKL